MRKKRNINIIEGILTVLNSKYVKWTGAIMLLGVVFQFGRITEKVQLEREYQLLDERRIKENSDKIDDLRNKIYDYRDENFILQQKVNMYELKSGQKNEN